MKYILTIFTLLFTTMLSSTSFSAWTEVTKGGDELNNGDTFFIDFQTLRKVDGYIYFWGLNDYLKPSKHGHFSNKFYKQGDCKLFRYKILSFSFHVKPMGRGTGEVLNPKNPEWRYPTPNSVSGELLKSTCSR